MNSIFIYYNKIYYIYNSFADTMEEDKIYTSQDETMSDESKILYVQPLQISNWRIFALIMLSILTFGVFMLFIWWFTRLRILFVYSYCNIKDADSVLVVSEGNFFNQ